MSFFDDLFKFFSSLFGGKKEGQPVEQQETVRVNAVDYQIPVGVQNMLAIIYQQHNMNAEEIADLENQIKTLGSLGHTHYVIHTHDRGETSPFYPISGDRYWELNYLKNAHTMSIINGSEGWSKGEMIRRGMEPIVYENLLS